MNNAANALLRAKIATTLLLNQNLSDGTNNGAPTDIVASFNLLLRSKKIKNKNPTFLMSTNTDISIGV